MRQATVAELEHDMKKRRMRREVFLEKMDALIPWRRLEERIKPFDPKAGRGRRPYPLGVMLRVYCVQLFSKRERPWDGGSALRERIAVLLGLSNLLIAGRYATA